MQGVNQLLEINRQLGETQQQISTGRRFLTPADDPLAATRVAALHKDVALREQYNQNISTAENDLNLEESVLAQTISLMQRVRELAVQGGNELLTNNDRGSLAAEIESRLDELFSLMNTRSANGDYLFSGFSGGTVPFVRDSTGTTVYQGDQGQRKIQISATASIAVTDSGKRIFEDVRSETVSFNVSAHPANDPLSNAYLGGRVVDQAALDAFYPDDLLIEFEPLADGPGNQPNFTVRRRSDNRVVSGLQNVAYVSGADIDVAGLRLQAFGTPQPGDQFFVDSTQKQSIATTMDNLMAGLRGNPVDTNIAAVIATSLGNLDQAIESVNQVRAEIGARLNTADTTRSLHDQIKIFSKDVLSQLQDTDYSEAVSRLSMQSFVLEAAQRSFVKISSLSLFNSL